MSERMKFLCALRSGGDFSIDDVDRLRENIMSRFTRPVDFVAVTDIPDDGNEDLLDDWPGWWCLIELFRFTGPCMFVGLDTVAVGNLDPFYDMVTDMGPDEFGMIRTFNTRGRFGGWASGVTAWNGDFHGIYDHMRRRSDLVQECFKYEQIFTSWHVREQDIPMKDIRSAVDGIYSYKRHCHPDLPEDARMVLFHGTPRPAQAKADWVRELYKGMPA